MGGLICGFGRETTCRAGCGFALARNAGDVSDGPGDGLLLGRESKGDALLFRPFFPVGCGLTKYLFIISDNLKTKIAE